MDSHNSFANGQKLATVCPSCKGEAQFPFMRKQAAFVCTNCGEEFEKAPEQKIKRGKVFLSYGHDPACEEIVQRFEVDLRARGWDPWLDKKRIEFGSNWRSEITRGLQQSEHVLAFLSEHSTRKPGVCRQEVAIALGPGKCHVYTVLMESEARCTPPLIISHRQWLDMQRWQELATTNSAEFEALYQKSLAEILRVLERNEPFAGEIEELQRWLDPINGTADMVASEDSFTGREWLLSGIAEQAKSQEDSKNLPAKGEIERWRTGASANSIFLLTAEPGWGKSAVAARLSHAGRARVLAVHFCKHNRPNSRDSNKVLRTIAFQMATQLEEYRGLLVQRARQGVVLVDMNPAELFHELLASQLVHVLGGGRGSHDRHLIVLDALDETLDEFGRSELVNLLASEFRKLPDWIGLVVTSRPEEPVLRQLAQFGIYKLEARDDRNEKDVANFVGIWLDKLQLVELKREQAMQSVLSSSANNFLYVKQLQEAVREGVIAAEDLMHPTALPRGLSSLYERWFQQRFKEPDVYTEHHRPMLELMLAGREPLPIELVSEVLAWGAYGQLGVLESFGSLCNRDEFGALNLFHKSLADWLINPTVSGKFHASPQQGHELLAAYVEIEFSNDPQMISAWPSYLLLHGAVHLSTRQKPALAAKYLTVQIHSEAANRLLPGSLRTSIDDYFRSLSLCKDKVLRNIASRDLAELLSRTDTRDAVAPVCDLLIERNSEWESAFINYPLDSRGATWVFASRWAHATLSNSRDEADKYMTTIRDVAITPSHPLNLPAAYAFKYIFLTNPAWLSVEILEPLCKSWTYSRLVATSLLQQLTLKGLDINPLVPWKEFWEPPWQYNRNELDLLAAAMRWKGFTCPIEPRDQTLRLMHSLAIQQQSLLQEENISAAQSVALLFFWDAGSDPDRCLELLTALDSSRVSKEIIDMYFRSPIFEAMEVSAGVVVNRLNEFSGDLNGLLKLADPQSDYAWGAFIAGAKASIGANDTETFLWLVNHYGNAKDPWCRGLSANYFTRWLRDASEEVQIQTIIENQALLVRLLHDNDIWPVQEIFHLLQDLSESLLSHGINWQEQFSAGSAPLVSLVPNWRDKDCGWADFEAAATKAINRNSQTFKNNM